MPHITKSLFVEFMDYPKLARRKTNNPLIYKKISWLETEEAEAHIMAIGKAVEDKVKDLLEIQLKTQALDLMPHFHKLRDQDSDDDDEVLVKSELDLPKAISDTITAIKSQVPLLYQPTFVYGDCLVRADFMVWNGFSYDLYEAKAKSSIRKSVKDDWEDKPIWEIEKRFIHDLSFQAFVINKVLESENLPKLQNIYIAYLNKEYIKKWPILLSQLLTQDQTWISREIQITQRNKPTLKLIDDLLISDNEIAKQIDRLKSYISLTEDEANRQFLRAGTRYLEYFWEDKPFGTIMWMWIHHSNASYIQDLFYSDRKDIIWLTDDEINWFNDNWQQFIAKYLDCKKSWLPIIQSDKIKEVFDGFKYPICFYDYETISVPVPIMDDTRPYMQTIVQYSLHKYYEDGTMKHYGWVLIWLGDYKSENIYISDNPNAVDEEYDKAITWNYKDLLLQMVNDIWEDLNNSTFVVWHKWFENSRNNEVSRIYPELATAFQTINNNTYDLKDIIANGYYFDIRCKWSASIKKVLPVLVPNMDYSALEIGRWDIAMRALYDLISWATPQDSRTQTIVDLLKYCWQDTLAMVRIFETLKRLI